MNQPQSKFPTMGTSATTTAKNASAEGTSGKLHKKGGAQAADPTIEAHSPRKHVKAKGGAAYGIRTSMPAWHDPAIAPLQCNGRLFTAAVNRTAPNFKAGYESLG